MTTENTTPVAAPIVPPTPIATYPVTYKDVTFNLSRHETQGKGDKAQPIPYWGIDRKQFNLPPVKDKDGKDVMPTDEEQAIHHVDVLAGLIGWTLLAEQAYNKVNTNLKASQLDQGKDKWEMADKAQYAKDYILADFGVNSKGGGAAIKALKETNTKQGEVLAKLASAFTRMQKATPQDAVAIMAEIALLTQEASKLASGA